METANRNIKISMLIVFALAFVAVTVVAVLLLSQSPAKGTPTSDSESNNDALPELPSTDDVIWSFNGVEWIPSNPAPQECAESLSISAPVLLTEVTGLLWPGQVRGNDYKSHGGFRFDPETNNHRVTAPTQMHLISASRYLESGQIQYFLVFSSPCGYVYKFDHVYDLNPKIAVIDDILPAPKEGDSRTTRIDPSIQVEAGEVIATSVGLGTNVFVDFGVHDVKQPNKASMNSDWAAKYQDKKEFLFYGICWLDNLPAEDKEFLINLPTGQEGSKSDYCN